jgi:hypothetical protein
MNLCPKCGANIALVGRTHRCVPKFEDMPILPKKIQKLYAEDIRKNFIEKNTGVRGGYTGGSGPKPEVPTTGSGVKSPFDRTAYQREYMRQWRTNRAARSS